MTVASGGMVNQSRRTDTAPRASPSHDPTSASSHARTRALKTARPCRHAHTAAPIMPAAAAPPPLSRLLPLLRRPSHAAALRAAREELRRGRAPHRRLPFSARSRRRSVRRRHQTPAITIPSVSPRRPSILHLCRRAAAVVACVVVTSDHYSFSAASPSVCTPPLPPGLRAAGHHLIVNSPEQISPAAVAGSFAAKLKWSGEHRCTLFFMTYTCLLFSAHWGSIGNEFQTDTSLLF
ncbi:hypothetical protein DAI22_02g116050 [Oryza sativa Japonica Group]|nr:hypothetical protein DAI22_02g116050 [Oryza sativa Japonica Group]